MHNYEAFEKDEYGEYKNQLESSQIGYIIESHKKVKYKYCKELEVAEFLYNKISKDLYVSSEQHKMLVINILTTAILRPNMAIIMPPLKEYNFFDFKEFIELARKLEKQKLVIKLAKSTDENNNNKPFVLLPIINPQKISDIIDEILDILEKDKSIFIEMKRRQK
jgi:hypothetical protein